MCCGGTVDDHVERAFAEPLPADSARTSPGRATGLSCAFGLPVLPEVNTSAARWSSAIPGATADGAWRLAFSAAMRPFDHGVFQQPRAVRTCLTTRRWPADRPPAAADWSRRAGRSRETPRRSDSGWRSGSRPSASAATRAR